MTYSMTFTGDDYDFLVETLFRDSSVENAAYLLCSTSTTQSETRLLVMEVLPVSLKEVISSSSHHMEIQPESFMRVLKRAAAEKKAFVFVHSHPEGFLEHSSADDVTEATLFSLAHLRVGDDLPHASLVLSSPQTPRGRVWKKDGSIEPIEIIRSIGDRFRFFFRMTEVQTSAAFDRQVRAFGQEIQDLLARIHIGVVGGGGTGSAVAEQLIRLGAGAISIFDDDKLDVTNVSRVYGSRVSDAGMPKVLIAKRQAQLIGLGTTIYTHESKVTNEITAKSLRDCDIIFGCTDDEWGRSIINNLAIKYMIPLFDMGVKIDSKDGLIMSVQGRVTFVGPGTSCLMCRGRITADGIAADVTATLDPENAENLRKAGYIPELQTNAPAVVAFTSSVAAAAVMELLHRLTGFMGSDRTSTETILFFDQTLVRANGGIITQQCFCQSDAEIGRGDQIPYLGTLWLS